jgi:ribosomal protein S7
MATMYLVQAFKQIGKKLVADPVQISKTAEKAVAAAERLAPMRAGVIAFSQEVDIETDAYDEPRVLLKLGTLPPGLME